MNFGVGELDDQRHLRDFNLAFTCESGWWGFGAGEEKQERAGRLERRPVLQPRCEVIMWGQWE